MNKKLFLAGVALLAAVGFTSCNSDTPINTSDPSGVTPTAVKHQVGGDYDWTAIVTDNAELQKFWNEDKADVAKLIGNGKIANIFIDVTGYSLKDETMELPDFFNGTGKGELVNIIISGNFKDADFLRADAMAGHKNKKYAVKINTDKLANTEVNFTFDAEKFDLDLASTKVRSTITSTGTIGWFKALAKKDNSAVIVKSGTVVTGIDNKSDGDIREEDNSILGLWVNADDATTTLQAANEKGFQKGQFIFAENVITEKTLDLMTQRKDDAKKFFSMGNLVIVKEGATVTLKDEKPTIGLVYAAEGLDASKCKVNLTKKAGLTNIGAANNVTFECAEDAYVELTKDVYTDVIFNCKVKFAVDKIAKFEDILFEKSLQIHFTADNQTVEFSGVGFTAQADLTSDIKVYNTEAETTYRKYQWVIETNTYEEFTKDSELKAYNATAESKEYTDKQLSVVAGKLADGTDGASASKVNEAKNYSIIIISHYEAAGEKTIIPEGAVVNMDGECFFWNGKKYEKNDEALNEIWGNEPLYDENCWYSVIYNNTQYVWKRDAKNPEYILVPVTAE